MNQILTPEILRSLYPYQIETIERQVRDYITINESSNKIVIDVCPKCGKVHPRIIKGGKANSGKQMYRCLECNKRFTYDHGSLTYYSHQDQDKWNDLILETQKGESLMATAAKLNINPSTAFRMRHKYLHFIEKEELPIQTTR